MASSKLDDDGDAIRAVFWKSIQSDGVAADTLRRTPAEVLVAVRDAR